MKQALPEIIAQLKLRFEMNPDRHRGFDWQAIYQRLIKQPDKLYTLQQMEDSGGEPDVISFDENSDCWIFADCSAESPKGRRSLCYDQEALESRKEFKPTNSALQMAVSMGITLMNESEYRLLQTLGDFDLKTSSWLLTPPPIRKLGGALFGDKRYDHVFVYHNGAQSYYAARGFRGVLRV